MALTITAPPIPVETPESAPFWSACRDGRLSIQKCDACLRLFFYPRARCPHCQHASSSWVDLSGRGTVYSFAINHVSPVPQISPPYVVVLVDLDEGVRMLSSVVDCLPEDVAVGMKVRVTFRAPFQDHPESVLPFFTPSDD